MKYQQPKQTDGLTPARVEQKTRYFQLLLVRLFLVAGLILLAALPVHAQAIRFTPVQNRITVPVGSVNSTSITNPVNLTAGATNANFDVSGLPAGASAVLMDTNGSALISTATDTNLSMTINTVNIAEGIYVFHLNAGGFDTNGLPVTNSFPFILQVAHIWNGGLNTSNNWSDPGSWLGGVPAATNDVVFTDIGAQTNGFINGSGTSFTNSYVTTNMIIGSLRFSQTGFTNLIITNPAPVYNHVHIVSNASLTITGTNGFSILRDYFDDLAGLNPINITISGDANAKLVVSNQAANFSVFMNTLASTVSTLNMSNLNTMVMNVNRVGVADYLLYPNYRDVNTALNVGRDTNGYNGHPARLTANVYLPRTNVITAGYKDPNNYTNEETRSYAFNLLNNEQLGIASSTVQNFFLGISNIFFVDGICFYGANGNGTTQFAITNSFAMFRNTNGTSPLSTFTVSDDGGTNEAGSNIKGIVDFSGGNVDILADRFYVARDRELIATNNTPNIQGTVTIGKGKVIVNSAVLGFQEHTKPDWTIAGNPAPYLNYCQGTLIITNSGVATNGGIFTVNGNLTLGYTADMNDSTHAQQFNTFGRVTVGSGATLAVSNIICDGGLNFYDANHRNNTISISGGGTLVVSNSIGGNNFVGSSYPSFLNPGSPALPLDSLTMASGSTLTLFVTAGHTNVYVRSFQSSGTTPGTIKIASLPAFPTYPTNISLIAYSSATPFVAADMSAIGGTVQGYIINNTANQTIDLFLTTNAAKTVTWNGNVDNNWNLETANWLTTNGVQTTFAMGDIAIFNDSTTVTNINVAEVVVPNQATNGVVISNSVNQFTFNYTGGSIAGTAKIVKQGTNLVTFGVAETGPFNVTAGELDVNGGFAIVGSLNLSSNVILNVTNNGFVNGNVAAQLSTVLVGPGSQIGGGLTMLGGTLINSGTISVGSGAFVLMTNAVATNTASGIITLGAATGGGTGGYEVFGGCTMANLGVITVAGGRLLVDGTIFGNGQFYDNVFPSSSASFGRLQIDSFTSAVFGAGAALSNSIDNMYIGARLDMHQSNPQNNTARFIVDLDAANDLNDTLTCARWNNIGCIWVMNNTNGSYGSGETFRVLVNANGTGIRNLVDTADIYPLMQPTVPGPGLQWNLTDLEPYGVVGITNSVMVWDGNGSSATWDTNNSTGNWKSSRLYGDNQGAIFDDTATGSTTVNVTTTVAPAGFNLFFVTNTDNLTFTNITQFSNAPAFSPGIIVSNAVKDYTIRGVGKITGMTSVYKTGPGTLSLLTSNDFTGGMVIEGGTLAFTNVNSVGIQNPVGQRPAYDQVVIDNATLKFFGTTNQNLGRPLTINQHGATIEVSTNTTILNLNQAINGSGGLTKNGLGILLMSQASSIYVNGTILNQGILRLTAAALGFGNLTLNGGTLELTNSPGLTITNLINVAGAATVSLPGNGTNLFTGPMTGSGTLTFNSTNTAELMVFNAALTNFSGTMSFGTSVGSFRFNNRTNDNPCIGSAGATFDLGTGSASLFNYNGAGLTYSLGGLAGGPNTTLLGRGTNNTFVTATTIYGIGANGANTTFSGKILNGVGLDTVSVVKVGSGTLLLNGNSTYSGSTTVSNGVLGGTGSIASALTVVSGATLAPGAASLGTFTVNNSATLPGAVQMRLNQANPGQTNDQLVVAGTLSGTGGALTVTNVGPILTNGATFKLFNKAVTFSTVTLPLVGLSTYQWTNNLAVDGSITLGSGGVIPYTPNPNPTNIVTAVNNNTLTLSWPADHIGWRLLVQTNPLNRGLYTNWTTVAGSTATNVINTGIDSNAPSIFYRLVLP